MSDTVIRVENLSKLYRLGEVGTGSLAHDVNRWWHKVRGKEDPYLKIGEVNDRTKSVSSVQRPESSAKKTKRNLTIAKVYIANYLMPAEIIGDALHVAIASYHKMDYLLTWNCNHWQMPTRKNTCDASTSVCA
jgi:hypothetical protein